MGGIGFYPWFILTEIGWSVIMAWVYNKTGKSSLIAGYLFHTAFNVWPFILLTNAIPGESLPAFDSTLFVVNALIVALLASSLPLPPRGGLAIRQMPRNSHLSCFYRFAVYTTCKEIKR